MRKDLVVIGDVKRGDIGSTSAAYATGHLGKVQVGSKTYRAFNEDFATVNPYLGYRWNQAICGCVQRGEKGSVHPCKDIQSVQR